ncbi:MAG: CPBP family intramembrane metalloprotease, partial [Gemmatimonadota bacterium]
TLRLHDIDNQPAGLFLKRLTGALGFAWANGITATVFALSHLGVEFAAALAPFLIVVFLLGLLWGWLMRLTDSVLASASLHAGADMLIVGNALETFSVVT